VSSLDPLDDVCVAVSHLVARLSRAVLASTTTCPRIPDACRCSSPHDPEGLHPMATRSRRPSGWARVPGVGNTERRLTSVVRTQPRRSGPRTRWARTGAARWPAATRRTGARP